MRSMTTAFPGPATSRLTSGVIHSHLVKRGRWYLPARRPAPLEAEARRRAQRHDSVRGSAA